MPQHERDQSLDFVRLIAILMVICIHASAKGFAGYDQRHWWGVNVYESVSRIAVPLFFMVSGALLLHREATVRSILSRTWRIAVPLLAWSVLYLCWFEYIRLPDFLQVPLAGWFTLILKAPVIAHLWYLYTLMGAYLFLPVLAGFFQANKQSTLLFVLGVWFIGATVVPTLFGITQREYLGINWSFLPLYAGYIVLGATLYRKVAFARSPLLPAAALWLACTAATAVLTWLRARQLGQASDVFYLYCSPFVALGASAAFVTLREIFRRFLMDRPAAVRVLLWLSRVNFGVYLVHVWLLNVFDRHEYDVDFINPWLAIPILTLAAFAMSAAIIALLRQVPLVRTIAPA